jgi:GT2 family glycosyltransferase
MKLSIIIVNWNTKTFLENCLNSIFKKNKNLDYEIIVVDNDSKDSSKDYLSKIKNEKIKVIINERNLGFAKANNLALKEAKGEYLLFLNPDTEFLEDSLEKIINFMEENKDCGIMGVNLIDKDNKTQLSVRNFPTLSSQILILLKIHHLFPNLKPLANYFLYDFDYTKKQEVNQVMGAFLVTKREIIKKIGGFDENFFLWFEEVDFCKRVKEAGFKIIYNPSIKVKHYGSSSFKQMLPFKKQLIFNKSLIYFFKKHHPVWQVIILKMIQPISLILALIFEIYSFLIKRYAKEF